MKTKKSNFLVKYWGPVCIWAFFIFIMSSIRGEDIPPLFAYQDIIYHLSVYFIFGVMLSRAMKNTFLKMNQIRQICFAIITGIIYALSDEFHQSFVSARLASLGDLSTDSVGVIFGSLIYQWQR